MNEGGHSRKSFNSSGPLRGGKRDLWEGGIRTPMIAWWPGRIEAGQESDHLSAFWDISPTLRELAGAKPQADTDGISMAPTLLGQGQQKQHEFLYWEFFEGGGKRAIRKGEWKLIEYNIVKSLNLRTELFNLNQDPAEQTNLADQHPQMVIELRQLMDRARTTSENPKFKLATEKVNPMNTTERIQSRPGSIANPLQGFSNAPEIN